MKGKQMGKYIGRIVNEEGQLCSKFDEINN